MNLKQAIILILFTCLILSKKWHIIVIMITVYLLFGHFKIQKTDDIQTRMENLVPAIGTDYYLQQYRFLKTIEHQYPLKVVNEQKLKIINQMLYNIPLPDAIADEWDKIRSTLMYNELIGT